MTALPRTSPRTKAARRELIMDLLISGEIRSQVELTQILIKKGFLVTQATVSRDLEDLGATKIRNETGSLTYGISPSRPHLEDPINRVIRVAQDLLISAEASANLVVLRTPPGGAHLLASALDQAITTSALPELLGTVAGDDTVLVITRKPEGGEAAAAQILRLSEGLLKTTLADQRQNSEIHGKQEERKRS